MDYIVGVTERNCRGKQLVAEYTLVGRKDSIGFIGDFNGGTPALELKRQLNF